LREKREKEKRKTGKKVTGKKEAKGERTIVAMILKPKRNMSPYRSSGNCPGTKRQEGAQKPSPRQRRARFCAESGNPIVRGEAEAVSDRARGGCNPRAKAGWKGGSVGKHEKGGAMGPKVKGNQNSKHLGVVMWGSKSPSGQKPRRNHYPVRQQLR